MSQVYTLCGQVKALKDDSVFFRKMLDMTDPLAKTERSISTILLKWPQPNVVRIMHARPKYIDMELLDLYHTDTSTQAADILSALEQLHSLRIVYTDLKEDNMGFSHDDKVWKLFDFDGSGMVQKSNDSEWEIVPAPFKIYKRYKDRCCHPFEIDRLAYDEIYST